MRARDANFVYGNFFYIITSNKQTTLNSRTELLNKCRHAKQENAA